MVRFRRFSSKESIKSTPPQPKITQHVHIRSQQVDETQAFTDKGSKYIADVLFSVFIGISWGLLDCFFRLSARGPVPMRFIFQVTAVLKYLYSHTTNGPNYLDPFQFAEKGVTVYSYLASITVLNDTKMIFS